MTQTLTAPNPAVFPDDVLAFAAERGVTEYLGPLYDLAKTCFDGTDVGIKLESDGEIADMSWIAFEVAVSDWNLDRFRAAYDRWIAGFIEACPSDDSIHFVLGMR